jgi:catechol 2,3-dioxygenase-like lactoylglutathione lyase family enzyme
MMTGSSIARNLAQNATGAAPREAACHAQFLGANLPQGRSQRRSLMSMSVGVLDHYNVSTRNLGDTVRFYEDVLGLTNGPRPPFDFPGAWLYSEGRPVLHLNDISPTDQPQRPDSGVIDHVAFGSRGFEAMKRHLAQKGVSFRVNVVPNSSRRQIFVTDPNNVLIELNFDVANEPAAA